MREALRDALDADLAGEQSVRDLIIGPTAWAVHFIVSYATAAVYCAKVGGDIAPMRVAIAAYTAAALVVIALSGLRAYRTWGGVRGRPPPLSHHTIDDRRRFIGFASLLLCTISFLAVLYGALPAVMFASCR